MPARWRVERTQSPRFPFRIAIEQDGRLLFAVRAQSDWPPPGGQIFCLREREHGGHLFGRLRQDDEVGRMLLEREAVDVVRDALLDRGEHAAVADDLGELGAERRRTRN